MDKELSPCPECGGKGEVIAIRFLHGEKRFFVECTDCYVDTGDYTTKEEAIEKWEKGEVS